jgi:uncharacterized damage-inducible protein DinB
MWKYDLWATKQWMDTLIRFTDSKRPDEIVTHILFAQWLWLDRCNGFFKLGLDLPAKPEAPSTTLAEELNQLWLSILDAMPSEAVLDYMNLAGEPMSVPFGVVVRHVPNHGTYHRGQLRGLAEVQMMTDFPETDFSRWAMQMAPKLV